MHYEDTLQQNGKAYSDLPTNLKQKINALKAQISKAAKSANPEKSKDVIEKQDIAIADAIQNWVEKDLPAPPPAETEEQKAARLEAEEAKKKEEEKKKSEEEAKRVEEENKNALMAIRNEIVKKANADSERLIHTRDLQAILGRKPGSKERVADITLVKIWMSEKYKVH
jgi:hypothetical protein